MKKIITSGEERRTNPAAAFILSLLAAGLGQVYCGSASRGMVLILLRIVSVVSVPCYAFINPGENLLNEIFIAVSAFLLLTILSPIEALIRSSLSRRVIKQGYNNAVFYISFAVITTLLTALSLAVFFSVFSFYTVSSPQRPLFMRGDILAVNKAASRFRSGETVMNRSGIPLRIIGLPGEDVVFSGGRFSINGSELPRSVFSESELPQYSLWDNDVIAEQNGNSKYAVVPSKYKAVLRLQPGVNEYYAAPDDRDLAESYGLLKQGETSGRIEGILFSLPRKKILIRSY